MVLVGPSGCGKTSALRMVAGLEQISAGTLRFGGRVVNEVPPRQRDVAMVFQNYALYPHLTVAQNIAFALENKKIPKSERERHPPGEPGRPGPGGDRAGAGDHPHRRRSADRGASAASSWCTFTWTRGGSGRKPSCAAS
jgi:ABC-type dipeptide/oligopeptide/nickel transport system ATPase component